MTGQKAPTLMIVDDHEIMRDGLRELIRASGRFEVVGQAGDGVAAVELALRLKPDVVIMDVMMPLKNGIDACREITEMLPDIRVLILTASGEDDAVMEAVAAGASGYLQKFSGKDRLMSAIQDVADGEYRIPSHIIRGVFASFRAATAHQKQRELDKLTQRDREILTFFGQGLTYAEIAKIRNNRPLTIRNAVYSIQGKLGINTKPELVVWAVRHGLLDEVQNKC